jgi:hypothetical protein
MIIEKEGFKWVGNCILRGLGGGTFIWFLPS